MQTAPQFGRRGLATASAAATPAFGGGRPSSSPNVDDATLAHILGRGQTSSPTASGGNTTLPLVLGYFFSFNGRIRRSLYWICQIAGGVLSTAGFYALTAIALQSKGNLAVASVVLLLSLVLMVLAIWSGLAVTVKRWHDRDKSGWWLFIAFLPLVGAIWALIECGFLDGTAGSNRFGPSPKGDLSAVFE